MIERRKSSSRLLIDRFQRAKDAGELPDALTADGLACYLIAIVQGMSLQAGAGASRAELAGLVDTSLAVWPTR